MTEVQETENEVQEVISWAFACVAGMAVSVQEAANAQDREDVLETGKTIYMFGKEAALIAAKMMMPGLSEQGREFLAEVWESLCDRESVLRVLAHINQEAGCSHD